MSPREKSNTQRINVFFAPDTLAQLKSHAQTKGTSVSGLVRMIVLDYLNKKK